MALDRAVLSAALWLIATYPRLAGCIKRIVTDVGPKVNLSPSAVSYFVIVKVVKKRQGLVIAGVVVLAGATVFFYQSLPKDRCTDTDREINNCVPAGKCGPTPAIDELIDCNIKDYDRKYNPEL